MGLSYALFLDLLLIPEFPLVISELDESYLSCYPSSLLSMVTDKSLSVLFVFPFFALCIIIVPYHIK